MDCGGSGGDWFGVRRLAEAEAVAAAAMARRPSTAWAEEEEEERPLTVVFASPAENFTDAAPIGNGSLGGMVWGGVATEKLQLNHDTLWTGAPGSYTNPDAPAALAAVRELVDQGRFTDATAAATRLFGGQSEVYQPMGDVNLELGGSDQQQAYDSYKRELDLHTATVLVTYSVGPVQYTREHFCSNPHRVIVTRIAASEPGHVSCTLSLSSQLKNTVTVTNANEVVMEGVCPGQRPPAPGLLLRNSSSSSNSISSSDDDDVTTGGIKFAAVLGVQMGGSEAKAAVLNDQKKLRLDTADWIVLVVAASTSFDGPFVSPSDSRLDPTSAAVATLNRARSLTYEQLKAAHLDDYQCLFHRVTLRLSPPGGKGT
ncbi:unnamed protein product, partial [Miscanthus lutarioriparius]